MGAMTVDGHVVADAGDIYREFRKRRRERALFQLSLEGGSGLTLTTHPSEFIVAASYEDTGYFNEPLRAKVITMDKMGTHAEVPFAGGTPDDLIDTMLNAYNEWSASVG